MPKLKTVYDTQGEIPEGYGELYTQKGEKFELTGVEGIKTQGDLDRLNTALVNERAEHKQVKEKLQKFNSLGADFDPEIVPQLQEQLNEANSRIDALGKEGKFDEAKVAERIAAAVATNTGPLERTLKQRERELDGERKKVADAKTDAETLRASIKQTKVRSLIREGSVGTGIVPQAIEDAVIVGENMFELKDNGELLTKLDIPGVTPGLTPKEWYKEMEEKRPFWFPQSVGGGSRGGVGPGGMPIGKDNPWSAEGWNLTKQGAYLRTNGAEKASQLAQRAGSLLGAVKPPAAKA